MAGGQREALVRGKREGTSSMGGAEELRQRPFTKVIKEIKEVFLCTPKREVSPDQQRSQSLKSGAYPPALLLLTETAALGKALRQDENPTTSQGGSTLLDLRLAVAETPAGTPTKTFQWAVDPTVKNELTTAALAET